jgi:KDO2-lipid IV(A) lauroyltransferase
MKFKSRRYYLYYLGRCLAFVFYLMPLRIGLSISSFLGTIAFRALPEYRRLTLDNLSLVFGAEKSPEEIERIALGVFRNLAKNTVELVNFPKVNKSNVDEFVTIENADILDRAFARGRGVIILTAHFGNWEFLALALRAKYPGVTVGRKIYFKKYDEYLNKLRKINDVNVIYRDDSPKAMLKVLKKNEILGIVADQDVDSVSGVFVNFFGRQAYTPVGPAVLAKASGAALVPAFIVRQNRHHRLIVEKPVELADTGDKEKDIVTNTQRWSDVVESYIRRYPDQWVWMHRRWKTQDPKN